MLLVKWKCWGCADLASIHHLWPMPFFHYSNLVDLYTFYRLLCVCVISLTCDFKQSSLRTFSKVTGEPSWSTIYLRIWLLWVLQRPFSLWIYLRAWGCNFKVLSCPLFRKEHAMVWLLCPLIKLFSPIWKIWLLIVDMLVCDPCSWLELPG